MHYYLKTENKNIKLISTTKTSSKTRKVGEIILEEAKMPRHPNESYWSERL